MNMVRVAVAQTLGLADMEENLKTAERMIALAAEKGAKLVVLPENMNYVGDPNPVSIEKVPEGRTCQKMAEAAKKYGIWVNLGSIREKTGGKPYNTSVLFDPTGAVRSTYRKLHLCDMQGKPGAKPTRESDYVEKGDKIEVVETELGTIGMSICYDLRFPEMFRIMSDKGAKIVCHPVCFTDHTGQAHLELLMRANAVFCHCYVLTANHCGTKANGSVLWGHSMIIDPWGTVLAQAGHEEEELLVADIDLDYCDDLRGRLGCMTNRREDIYSLTEL